MTLVLIISILLRVAAMAWSVVLLRRIRDWRMGFVALTLALMTYRQGVTLWNQPRWWPPTMAGVEVEWSGLAVSVLALLMVGFLGKLLTERRQSETRISESEARYRRAEAGTTDGLWEWNIATGGEYCSPRWLEILGYAPGESPKTLAEFVQLIHPDDRARAQAESDQSQRDRRPFAVEMRLRRKDGTYLPVLSRGQIELDTGGQPVRMTGAITDISARKRSEETETERNKLAQQISMIATNAPGALASFRLRPDGRGGFPYASPAWLSLFALTQAEVAEDTGPLLQRLHPDDVANFLETIQQSARSLTDWRDEFRVLHPGRGELWVAGHSTPVREADGSILWHGFITDITERKRAEAALRAQHAELENLYATTPVGLALIDRDLRFVRINEQLAAVNGKPVEAHIGRTIQEALPELAPVLTPIYRRVLDGKTPVLNVEIQGETPAEPGVLRDWLASYHPVRASDGSVTGVSISVLEITERKRAETARAADLAALTELQRIEALYLGEGDLAQVLDELVGAAIAITGADFGNLQLHDPATDTLTIRAQRGFPPDWLEFWNTLHVGKGACHLALARRQRVLVEDVTTDPIFAGTPALPVQLKAGVRAVQSTPIVSRTGQVLGMVSTQWRRPHRSTDRELRWLDLLAGQTADILERGRVETELRESEARLRIVTDNARVGLVLVSPEHRYIFANAAYAKVLGLPDASIIGQRVADVLPEIYQQQIAPRLSRAFAGERVAYELHRQTPAGETAYTVNYEPILAGDKVSRVVVVIVDITERKQAEQDLHESRTQLRALLARLQQSREEERIRVSREIHDELGQLLTGLKMDVRWLERKLAAPGLPPAMNPLLDRAVEASAMADATIATVQKIAEELRPGALDQLGLAAALAQEVRRFQERSGVHCTVQAVEPVPLLPATVASELFYICQEALTNVARHARAAHVWIALRSDDGVIVLEVRDDGVGMTGTELGKSGSLGLLGMRERAGQCGGTIAFARNEPQGTRVTVSIPVGTLAEH